MLQTLWNTRGFTMRPPHLLPHPYALHTGRAYIVTQFFVHILFINSSSKWWASHQGIKRFDSIRFTAAKWLDCDRAQVGCKCTAVFGCDYFVGVIFLTRIFAGLTWALDFNPHTRSIPTEKPAWIPTESPYPQNPEILHTHTHIYPTPCVSWDTGCGVYTGVHF